MALENTMRTYSELIKLESFKERFEYLKLEGNVGKETFGFDRYLNQIFYKSKEWESVRREVIVRDFGCDLGIEGYEIFGKILVHHMNPISIEDIVRRSDFLLNPDYLITTSPATHNAIHYGDYDILIPNSIITRTSNDTCPWKR